MASGLLSDIYYGNELDQFYPGTAQIRKWFSEEKIGTHFEWGAVDAVAREYFLRRRDGVFGGQITAGDGISITAFMAALRPECVIEFGVASGYSSAFILYAASKYRLIEDRPFLYSFDLVAKNSSGLETGSFARSEYPELMKYWKLFTEKTSLDVIASPEQFFPAHVTAGPTMAFIDGGHNHPWPLTDIVAMRRILPKGSWLVLQDAQMMERWIADTVIYNVPCPRPVRGVNLAVSLWPGLKQIGMGLNFNTCAICLDVSDAEFETYVRRCLSYPDEIPFEHRDLLLAMSQVR